MGTTEDAGRTEPVDAGLAEPPDPAATVARCGRCGEPLTAPHPVCDRALALEPPRYCVECGRRMVVQVVPRGWVARCSRHGEISG